MSEEYHKKKMANKFYLKVLGRQKIALFVGNPVY